MSDYLGTQRSPQSLDENKYLDRQSNPSIYDPRYLLKKAIVQPLYEYEYRILDDYFSNNQMEITEQSSSDEERYIRYLLEKAIERPLNEHEENILRNYNNYAEYFLQRSIDIPLSKYEQDILLYYYLDNQVTRTELSQNQNIQVTNDETYLLKKAIEQPLNDSEYRVLDNYFLNNQKEITDNPSREEKYYIQYLLDKIVKQPLNHHEMNILRIYYDPRFLNTRGNSRPLSEQEYYVLDNYLSY